MNEIITITLNPAVDKTYSVPDLVPEHKLRCANPVVEAGGGGINVAKGLKELDASCLAVFFAGGRNGAHLVDILKREGVNCKPINIEGETRESLVIIDQSTRKEFRVVVEGPVVDMSAFDEVINLLELQKPAFIVASGSLPKGLPEDVYGTIARKAKAIGSKLILDSSGPALDAALSEGVYLLKPNLKELSNLAGIDHLKIEQVPAAAGKLISEGRADVIVVSMSSAGAYLVTEKITRHFATPEVEQRSTVGAGDSMVSGMVWALQQNKSLEEMVCWGLACGSATTMHTGTDLFKKEDVDKLFQWVVKNGNM